MEIAQLKNVLVESTIDVVSKNGLLGATTKAICQKAKCNEVYIYRIFGGKNELLSTTFDLLDSELANCIEYALKKPLDGTVEEDFKKVFATVWEFLMDRRARVAFLVRYYHSSLYANRPHDNRKQLYARALKRMQVFLKPECDAWWVLNWIYDLVFNTIGRIIKGEEKDELGARDKICEVVFHILYPCVKIE